MTRGRIGRRRRTQQERVEETRAKLVQATVECIIELGYCGATLTEITRRASVSIGAAQHHFQSKTDLIFAAINHVFTEMHNFLTDVSPVGKSIDERIDRILAQYWTWFGSPTYLAAWELIIGARQDPALRAMIRERIAVGGREINRMWQTVFADCGVSDEDLDNAIKFIFATLRGMALMQIFEEDDGHRPRILSRLEELLRATLKPPAT